MGKILRGLRISLKMKCAVTLIVAIGMPLAGQAYRAPRAPTASPT